MAGWPQQQTLWAGDGWAGWAVVVVEVVSGIRSGAGADANAEQTCVCREVLDEGA